VEIAQSSEDLTGVRFTRPDDANVQGDVTIFESELEERTSVYVSYQDISKKATGGSNRQFVLGASRPLPKPFPEDVPIYQGKSGESTVRETILQRAAGNNNMIVSFLTKDGQTDVMNFYRNEFGKRGWTVTDTPSEGATSFAVSIDFTDGNAQQIVGTVRADSFDLDSAYTQVDLILQVKATRGRGN
jgi:hypothetical protein